MQEPTHKRVLATHQTDSYGTLTIYFSGSFRGAMKMKGDHVYIGTHRLTPEELQRGWYDADDN